jgi:alpha-N-acetylglucosaminidase
MYDRLRHLLVLTLLAAGLALAPHRACAESAAANADEVTRAATAALLGRVVPGHAHDFVTEIIPQDAGHDVFEIESMNGRIVLRGNNGVSLASALNWYLKYNCHGQISWCGDNLELPKTLPAVEKKIRIVSPFQHRVDFNYCTFSYTMAFWDWPRWEREIDWMAMHGINMPLAITGQEAVWQATLRKYGMSDEEIRQFLCGPAFFAWQYMANLEGWGGPLPQSWIESHTALGQRILQRERELGMTPILQGFTGFVPRKLKEKHPEARIQFKPNWCDVFASAAQLDPLDPLFKQMGKTFIEEQTRLFGTNHWYAADPFHESAPPSNAPDYLPAVAKNVLDTMESADPDAKIAMQTWSLREPLVRNIPEDRILLLALVGGGWQHTSGFWGRPWIAGALHNYGGRIFTGGNVSAVLGNALKTREDPAAGKLDGIGMFPEATQQNPVYYDAATEIAWHSTVPDYKTWMQQYVRSRYPAESPDATAAWDILAQTVYNRGAESGSAESPICSRPALIVDRAAPNASMHRHYNVPALWDAWAKLQAAAPKLGTVDTYQYDLVDLARQCLTDLSIPVQRDITAAYRTGNAEKLREAAARFLDLAQDMDTLLGTRKEFLLGTWIDDAKHWATTDAERRLYERNARLQVTVWGPSAPGALLFDYSDRQWSGLIRGYYMPRWQKFIDYLATQPQGKDRFTGQGLHESYNRPADDANPFYAGLAKWEQDWCDGTEPYPAAPQGDPVATAAKLLAKWGPQKDTAFARFNPETMEAGASGDAAIYSNVAAITLKRPAWTPAECSKSGSIWNLDAGNSITAPGTYTITLAYTSGDSALTIQSVAVLQGDREIASDRHAGWTGDENRRNTYTLTLDKVDTTKPRIVQIRARTASSTNSRGQITIEAAPK